MYNCRGISILALRIIISCDSCNLRQRIICASMPNNHLSIDNNRVGSHSDNDYRKQTRMLVAHGRLEFN